MTDTPETPGGANGDDEGPIRPEVVRRGAAARKRRLGGGDGPPVPAAPPTRAATGLIFRMGCLLLLGLGLVELFAASQFALDPAEARCRFARSAIEDANDDDEDFNDVTLPEGVDNADELGCEQAADLAGSIPADEDEEADGEFVSESTVRNQGLLFAVLGLGHGLGGFFTLRTRQKRVRTVALVFAALGMLIPVLGIFSALVIAFVVYALLFSNDAKAIFGQTGGFFRPRPPKPAAP